MTVGFSVEFHAPFHPPIPSVHVDQPSSLLLKEHCRDTREGLPVGSRLEETSKSVVQKAETLSRKAELVLAKDPFVNQLKPLIKPTNLDNYEYQHSGSHLINKTEKTLDRLQALLRHLIDRERLLAGQGQA